MNILLVSSYLPYPLFSGGNIRLYNLIRELSKKHTITLICEKRIYQTKDDIEEVGKFCTKIITVLRKRQWSVSNILKTAFSSFPFLMVGHSSSQMSSEIDKVVRVAQYDVVHVETFYVMQNLPQINVPLVLAEHNIEYLVYQRFARQAFFLLQPLLLIDIAKMKYWEERFWKQAGKLIAVSDQEKKFMKRKDAVVVANGVDLQNFKFHPQDRRVRFQKKEKRALFIGDFRWVQNRDAIEWLIKEIWPNLKGDVKLWIVGRSIPDTIKYLTKDVNIIFDENASEDTEKIFRLADVLLAPIRVGGGTSFKILEAMATGVPVVTTSLGIEGIEAENGKEVLIAEDAESLAKKTREILDNDDLYQKIAKNARMLIEKKYDWEKIVTKLEQVYTSVANT